MANSITYQTLQDGPRNVIVKAVGIIDTADIALAGTPKTCGITTGSPTVTIATTTDIVVGQRVTGTGIPANTYITAVSAGVGFTISQNATATNAAASLTLGGAVLFDPAVLSKVDDYGTGLATKCSIQRLVFTIEAPLECRLYWDATTPVIITDLTGAAHQELNKFGGLQNNAGAGVNGMILLVTQGFTAGSMLSFNLVMEVIKQK